MAPLKRRRSTATRAGLACLAAIAAPAFAAAPLWEVVPEHSRLGFVASWEGTAFEGVFRRFEAGIRFDPREPGAGGFDVSIDMASADTDSADRDAYLVEDEWFSAARHPLATYVTSAIEARGGDRFEAVGTLTIKGLAREVRLPFTWTQEDGAARMTGATRIRRTNFAVGEGEWSTGEVIGLDVEVRVDLELRGATGEE